ncbi:acyltransferase family protein [Kineococcus sp. DHX-1]|uniref:acyltransferase family protein n=1 Tax=Kineococcus sp. DHX-1 TaxID=3349638 RepID=UPI0036D357D0
MSSTWRSGTVTTPDLSVTEDRTQRVGTRLDIQGLRAVAVALVVLYHAGVPGLSGGYVGVDVFFVISGFLIIGHLVTELRNTGRIDLGRFWAKRIRRLAPASALVLLVTLALALLLLPPLALPNIVRDALATALYVPNVRFAVTGTDYLASSDPSPFLHYWSLGVEEQFYVLFPLLLWLCAKTLRRPVPVVLTVLLVGSVASLLFSVWLTAHAQPWAFFNLPTRAWEFAAGGLTAVVAVHLSRKTSPRWLTEAASAAGLGLIGASVVRYTDGTPFPGWHALVPVVGTALVLGCGSLRHGITQRALAIEPLTRTGDVSYSLYLWHWPLLVIPAQSLATTLEPWTRAGLVAAAVALAVLTYRCVENPARRQRALATTRRSYGLLAAATCLTVLAATGVGASVHLDSGRSAATTPGGPVDATSTADFVPRNALPSLESSPDDVGRASSQCLGAFTDTATPRCVGGDARASRSIVLFGDSHAATWFEPLDAMARRTHYKLVTFLKSSCPAASLTAYQVRLNRPFSECDTWRSSALQEIQALSPEAVVIAGYRNQQVVGEDSDAAWAAAVATTTRALVGTSAVYWLEDNPEFPQNVPNCLSAHLTDALACGSPRTTALSESRDAAQASAVRASGGSFVATADWFCLPTTCPTVSGRFIMYRDAHHMTTSYAASLADVLGRTIDVA